jgi:hypothetical protein
MQKNFIETYDVLLSAQNATKMDRKNIIRNLNSDQHRRIISLEDLIKKIEQSS